MSTSINQVLANNLAYWMAQAGLTQSALAEKAGVSQKTISNYLNPQQRAEGSKGKEPSAKLTELDRIAGALHISVWQLLREMSDTERKMYDAIEEAYVKLVAQASTDQRALEENQIALKAATIPKPAAVRRKKAA